MKKAPLVLVTWLDATSSNGWATIEEAKASGLATVESVGWLIHKDKKTVVLAHSAPSDAVLGHTTIPAGWVRKVERLRP